MTFKELNIINPILDALNDEGYEKPSPIQEQSIPILLKGKDLLGCAQTGTGKTAAFAIPILQKLYNNRQRNQGGRKIKALIVTPTRELAIQISDSFTKYGKYTGLRNTVVFGGVKQGSQTNELRKGVDILVATPGRLLDLIGQGLISLKHIEYSVLDEADHMLDMGFIHDIKRIIALLPHQRQSLFFSATMPPDIVKLSKQILGNPEKVTISPEKPTADRVEQSLYYVIKKAKARLLIHIIEEGDFYSVLVFSRTKYGADKIVKVLNRAKIKAEAIHGNKSQGARQRALSNFKEGKTQVLVATDIAARGIDVSGLSLVVNYDLPSVPETYVHRIGRTGRASASGIAISFCQPDERAFLKDIQKLISKKIDVIEDHPFVDEIDDSPAKQTRPPRQNRSKKKSGSADQRSSSRTSDGSSNKRNDKKSEGANRSKSKIGNRRAKAVKKY
ncbi:MAG: DEAD/DEAH box helicase [Bacteroidales bacterium]|nr:DEAD/DEAH box helicase [Bacteroidales bacterium]